ncbi:MAG: hypothetical protein F4W92_04345 [Gammaproteobacteria bacterium]|nr:hypothetical protein [Gammaproteobacteria bacterium]
MKEVHLTGLEGTNPLGFLAALGVQVAFATKPTRPKLWWSDDVIPHAITDHTVDCIVDQILNVLPLWKESPSVNPTLNGSSMPKGDELKMSSDNIRQYLDQACQHQVTRDLGLSLIAEGSTDKKGASKPSDLYFSAGPQKFLASIRKIMDGVSEDDIRSGLLGPWKYSSVLPSMGWDVTDDRTYALRSRNPSSETKPTNPGPEALAILGLSIHSVFARIDRTITLGCSGTWKYSTYTWPIWNKPASPYSVKSLLTHTYIDIGYRSRWFASWGIRTILRSTIRRSSQSGYGTFSPPEVVWQAL